MIVYDRANMLMTKRMDMVFLSLNSLSDVGFSFASYFFSPSSASTHRQLFNEFEQVPILNSALFSQAWIRLASGEEESI